MKCPTPIRLKQNNEFIDVPCSKCGACRHNRRVEWSFRLKQELKNSASAFFITMTYSDKTIPEIVNEETGEIEISLRKRDVQLYIKRLRQSQKSKIRYYCVGEYGTQTQRPHYHILLFNLEEKVVKEMEKIWSYGFIYVGHVTQASIHYVTKYHVNKSEKDDDKRRESEFTLMSRKPGIGYNYVYENGKWNKENQYFFVKNNGYAQNIPRYYKNKIFDENEIKLQAEKAKIESDKKYNLELKKLEHKRVKNPDTAMYQSELNRARKVKDKSTEGDLF